MSRRAVETYYDQRRGVWANRLEGGDPVGFEFIDQDEAANRGRDLARFLNAPHVVYRVLGEAQNRPRQG